MEPSATVRALSACPSVIWGCSSSTSTIRRAQAMERVRIIMSIDTIISDIRISDA